MTGPAIRPQYPGGITAPPPPVPFFTDQAVMFCLVLCPVLQPVGVSLAGHLPRDGDFKGLGRTLPARYVTTATSPTVQPSCMASVSRVRLGSGGRSAAHPPSSRRLTTATVVSHLHISPLTPCPILIRDQGVRHIYTQPPCI